MLTIGFVYGAYMTETFRGAFLSIPRGQIEAGIAAGMSPSAWSSGGSPGRSSSATRCPASATTGWSLLKSTALVSVLGLQDLVKTASDSGRSVRMQFTFLFVAFVIYLLMTIVSDIGQRLARTALQRRRQAGLSHGRRATWAVGWTG